MENVKYTIKQIEKIITLLNQVSVTGETSVTALAMIYQELNNGEVIKELEDKDEEGE